MSLFSFNIKSNKQNNKLSFFIRKHKVSFFAYEILKRYVVDRKVPADKLDFIHPNNWKPKVLKKVSARAIKTLKRLALENKKNDTGQICQNYNEFLPKKNLSKNAKVLLKKIKNNESRYEKIDFLIKKYKINKALK